MCVCQPHRFGWIRALRFDLKFLMQVEPLAALEPIVRNEVQTQMRELFASLRKTVVLENLQWTVPT